MLQKQDRLQQPPDLELLPPPDLQLPKPSPSKPRSASTKNKQANKSVEHIISVPTGTARKKIKIRVDGSSSIVTIAKEKGKIVDMNPAKVKQVIINKNTGRVVKIVHGKFPNASDLSFNFSRGLQPASTKPGAGSSAIISTKPSADPNSKTSFDKFDFDESPSQNVEMDLSMSIRAQDGLKQKLTGYMKEDNFEERYSIEPSTAQFLRNYTLGAFRNFPSVRDRAYNMLKTFQNTIPDGEKAASISKIREKLGECMDVSDFDKLYRLDKETLTFLDGFVFGVANPCNHEIERATVVLRGIEVSMLRNKLKALLAQSNAWGKFDFNTRVFLDQFVVKQLPLESGSSDVTRAMGILKQLETPSKAPTVRRKTIQRPRVQHQAGTSHRPTASSSVEGPGREKTGNVKVVVKVPAQENKIVAASESKDSPESPVEDRTGCADFNESDLSSPEIMRSCLSEQVVSQLSNSIVSVNAEPELIEAGNTEEIVDISSRAEQQEQVQTIQIEKQASFCLGQDRKKDKKDDSTSIESDVSSSILPKDNISGKIKDSSAIDVIRPTALGMFKEAIKLCIESNVVVQSTLINVSEQEYETLKKYYTDENIGFPTVEESKEAFLAYGRLLTEILSTCSPKNLSFARSFPGKPMCSLADSDDILDLYGMQTKNPIQVMISEISRANVASLYNVEVYFSNYNDKFARRSVSTFLTSSFVEFTMTIYPAVFQFYKTFILKSVDKHQCLCVISALVGNYFSICHPDLGDLWNMIYYSDSTPRSLRQQVVFDGLKSCHALLYSSHQLERFIGDPSILSNPIHAFESWFRSALNLCDRWHHHGQKFHAVFGLLSLSSGMFHSLETFSNLIRFYREISSYGKRKFLTSSDNLIVAFIRYIQNWIAKTPPVPSILNHDEEKFIENIVGNSSCIIFTDEIGGKLVQVCCKLTEISTKDGKEASTLEILRDLFSKTKRSPYSDIILSTLDNDDTYAYQHGSLMSQAELVSFYQRIIKPTFLSDTAYPISVNTNTVSRNTISTYSEVSEAKRHSILESLQEAASSAIQADRPEEKQTGSPPHPTVPEVIEPPLKRDDTIGGSPQKRNIDQDKDSEAFESISFSELAGSISCQTSETSGVNEDVPALITSDSNVLTQSKQSPETIPSVIDPNTSDTGNMPIQQLEDIETTHNRNDTTVISSPSGKNAGPVFNSRLSHEYSRMSAFEYKEDDAIKSPGTFKYSRRLLEKAISTELKKQKPQGSARNSVTVTSAPTSSSPEVITSDFSVKTERGQLTQSKQSSDTIFSSVQSPVNQPVFNTDASDAGDMLNKHLENVKTTYKNGATVISSVSSKNAATAFHSAFEFSDEDDEGSGIEPVPKMAPLYNYRKDASRYSQLPSAPRTYSQQLEKQVHNVSTLGRPKGTARKSVTVTMLYPNSSQTGINTLRTKSSEVALDSPYQFDEDDIQGAQNEDGQQVSSVF